MTSGITMYAASVQVFTKGLGNLALILEKAQAHAAARTIEPANFIQSRLFPDMLPLSSQVQIASDSAKGGAARLAGVTPPAFADEEKTFPELVERCRKTIAFLETLTPAQFEGSEGKTITWKVRAGERSMPGLPYLLHQVTPNFYFHLTTAYDILRHGGVEIGKKDFLNNA